MAICKECEPRGCKNAQCDVPGQLGGLKRNCDEPGKLSACTLIFPNGKGEYCHDVTCEMGRQVIKLGQEK